MIIIMSKKTRSVLTVINNALSTVFIFLIFLALGFISPASAALFTVDADIDSGADQFSASFDTVDDAFDQLTTSNLQAAMPSYVDPVSTATIVVNYRGLDMNFAFPFSSPDPNANTLTLSIPELGINESFTGATRDESKDMLVEFLEGDGADTIDRIQKELTRVSATDPVAGNPGSLMGQLVDADFDLATSINPIEFAHTPGGRELLQRVMRRDRKTAEGAFSASSDGAIGEEARGNQTGPTGAIEDGQMVDEERVDKGGVAYQADSDKESKDDSKSEGSTATSQSIEASFQSPGGVFGVDLSHRSLDLEGEKATTETLTIEYEYYFQDPLKVIRFKMPLAVTDTEGAKSYHANAGIDFSYPVTRSWSLTPGVSYGVGGSEDLGGGASINGVSLTSTYRLVYGDYLYTIGNMVGRYETGSVSLGDYEINPDVSNTVLRNGLIVFRPSIIMRMPTMIQLFLVDTRYSGDELFTEHYYEIGFALGLITDEALISEDTFNLGLTYLDATDADIKGYKVNFGYRF